MTKELSCFKCKHSDWRYREDSPIPIVEYLDCMKGHQKTTQNIPIEDIPNFSCDDYEHSYFIKEYWGIWCYIIFFSLLALLLVLMGVKK